MSYPCKAVLAAPRWSLHGALLLCESFSLLPLLWGEDLQGCTLAEPSDPWCLTFALGWLENLTFFIQIICWAPKILRASFHFLYSTALTLCKHKPQFIIIRTWQNGKMKRTKKLNLQNKQRKESKMNQVGKKLKK